MRAGGRIARRRKSKSWFRVTLRLKQQHKPEQLSKPVVKVKSEPMEA